MEAWFGLKALFPLDGSQVTYAAVEKGLGLIGNGKDVSATFLVVMSKGVRGMPADAREYLEFDDEDEVFVRPDEAQAVIDKAAAIAKRLKFTNFKGVTAEGKVKETILLHANKHDLLVMHGMRLSEREDKEHGNAVEELARTVGTNVLLIRT